MSKEYVNYHTVSNPEGLEKLLNNIVKEIDLVRALVNEMRTDRALNDTIVNELKSDFNAHTHVTGGTTSSGISVTIGAPDSVGLAAAAVTEYSTKGK